MARWNGPVNIQMLENPSTIRTREFVIVVSVGISKVSYVIYQLD